MCENDLTTSSVVCSRWKALLTEEFHSSSLSSSSSSVAITVCTSRISGMYSSCGKRSRRCREKERLYVLDVASKMVPSKMAHRWERWRGWQMMMAGAAGNSGMSCKAGSRTRVCGSG
jgi:hypothetical protein